MILSISSVRLDTNHYKIDAFMKQLCCDIRYTRLKNMNSDYSTYIRFNKKNSSIREYILREHGEDKRIVKLPDNVITYNSVEVIDFTPFGKLDQQGETITIIYDKKEYIMTIVPFSGRVLIKEDRYSN